MATVSADGLAVDLRTEGLGSVSRAIHSRPNTSPNMRHGLRRIDASSAEHAGVNIGGNLRVFEQGRITANRDMAETEDLENEL